MKKVILATLSCMAILFTMNSCQCNKEKDNVNSPDAAVQQEKYICPMNCENGKTYDKSGSCPVCGMDLTKQ